MKKTLISLSVIATSLMLAATANAASEECTEFGVVGSNWGMAYVTDFYGSNGGIRFRYGNINCNYLPYGTVNKGVIYSFCCYNGKIYYMTGYGETDPEYPASIYSCDMFGNNNRLLANNVYPWSDAYIVDNVLYYQEYRSQSYGAKGYNGGVYRINLNNLSWKKIVDGDVTLRYTDGDYVYYSSTTGTAAVSNDGSRWIRTNSSSDEYRYDYKVRGNKTYYISGNYIYEKTRNGGNATKLCSIAGKEYVSIDCITESYLYYTSLDIGRGGNWANLYRVHR